MRALTPRERKLVALAIALMLLTACWLVVVEPVIDGISDRATQREQLRAEYARDLRLAAGFETWRGQLAEQKSSADRFAIGGATQQLAAGTLSTRIQRLVLEAGGTVKSLQTVDDASSEEVRVRAGVQLTMEQLYRTLKQLEVGVPYVVVEYLSVGADNALQSGHLGPMDVRLEVSAQYRSTDTASQ